MHSDFVLDYAAEFVVAEAESGGHYEVERAPGFSLSTFRAVCVCVAAPDYLSLAAIFSARVRKATDSGPVPRAAGVPLSPSSRMLWTSGI